MLCCLWAAAPAGAESHYYNAEPSKPAVTKPEEAEAPPAKSFTVTSIDKCYAALGPEDALDIQRNYIKPYQECQRRLALKLKKAAEQKAGTVPQNPPAAAHGFYRVQKEKELKKDDADKKPQP